MVLRDRVAVVTGSSMGIGRAIAEAFLREGCSTVLVARGKETLDATKRELVHVGATVESFPADVTHEQDVEALFEFTLRKFGSLDILVNCAGIYGPIGLTVDVSPAEWLRTIEVNVFGVFLCIQYALKAMIRQGTGGKIINLAGGGATSPFPRFGAYAASKAAIARLTETVAQEVKGCGIDINAIAPGAVNTRLLDEVLQAGEAAGTQFYQRSLQQKEDGGVSPRVAAELAVFLASSASNRLTGRLISAVWDNWHTIAERIPAIAETDLYTLRRVVPNDRTR
jgi:3-oxoacyl-[acyl-carrier protein] reductase